MGVSIRCGPTATAILGVLLLAACTTTTSVTSEASSATRSADHRVTTLAKLEGWRDGRVGRSPHATLEIAYDDASAQALWAGVVDDDLPRAAGHPVRPGVYGDLAAVDFDTQVVAVVSAGESGSCPRWVSEISTAAGVVAISTADATGRDQPCTADFRRYRVIITIDRDDVPPAASLDDTQIRYDGSLDVDASVVAYPSVG